MKKAVRYAKNLDELYKSVKRDMPEIKNFVMGVFRTRPSGSFSKRKSGSGEPSC